MRIVHVRSEASALVGSGLRRNDGGERGNDAVERRDDVRNRGDDASGRWDGDSGATKFGMLRLTFGELDARSSACEVPSVPEWIGAAERTNGDQEV